MTMQPDQQQRILGYFLEEAREHLNTIEQGLLNLQSTLNDTEMIQEVFRAAHSIKGGAAMLGLSSIQHTSHRLEDCFKILKDHPIQVDQTLESLLLGVCDTLKALIDHLGNPFGLSEETAQELMAKTEPVMQTLHDYIATLVGNENVGEATSNSPTVHPQTQTSVTTEVSNAAITIGNNQDWTEFQTQVLQTLREMLQLFKQTSVSSSRENLQNCCDQLVIIGRDINLSNWCKLCESAAEAISNPDNSYLTLAKIIITEIKQAQELVLQNRDGEIAVSQQLENLLPLPELELLEFDESDSDLSLFSPTDELNFEPELSINVTESNGFTEEFLFNDDQSIILDNNTLDHAMDHAGPEVGISELNTLADLFEGETPELDADWQQEEILEDINSVQLPIIDGEIEESNQDLVDLLEFDSDSTLSELPAAETDLSLLFDDNLLDIENDNLGNNTADDQFLASSYGLGKDSDSQFPEDDVLEELISISREARQNTIVNENNNSDATEELLLFTEDYELDELCFDGELTPSEIMAQTETEANGLFLPNVSEDISAPTPIITNTKTVKTPEIKPSVPESLSLDNIFAQVEENIPPVSNEIDDLFGTPDTINKVSSSVDNLDNFWDDLNSLNPKLDIGASQDVAKELEESLFSASFESVSNNNATPSHGLDGDFNLISQDESEPFDMFSGSDADSSNQDIDIFGEVADLNSTTANLDGRESSLPVVNEFSQAPEAVDYVPEFTSQFLEITANLDAEIFAAVADSSDDNLSLFGEEITFGVEEVKPELITNSDHSELSIFADSATGLSLDNELDFNSNFGDFNLESEANLIPELELETTVEKSAIDVESIELLLDEPVEETRVEAGSLDEFAAIELLLDEPVGETRVEAGSLDEFGAIESLLDEPPAAIVDDFAAIEALLDDSLEENTDQVAIQDEDFAALEALLGENENNLPEMSANQRVTSQAPVVKAANTFSPSGLEDEFSELEDLLAQADQSISITATTSQKTTSKIPRPSSGPRRLREETMKVPIKQLDEMSNLVGELVVNRNTLEQDHERLRQSLDNLLVQVQHLSDVGVRMQEYYERSLLEASLLASRRSREHHTSSGYGHDGSGYRGFSEIEMDRFTPFHILAQEMIEFIVRVRESASDIDFVTEETEQVARQLRQATSQLREGLTKARMVPFTQAIDRLRRGVRDNAIKHGKQVELVTEGVDTLVDKMILDHLTDPLTHMVNNAIAHGIETPDVRQAAGKSPLGTITIRALQQGNQTVISVADDGAGIDYQKVKNKAVKKGILTPEQAKAMSRLETYELLFLPSFSTADEVDDIKGRGVGMNVVQNDISEIRGTVSTDSTLGKGTTFTIRLPLTLSICKALFCISDRTRIAFPMDGVEDTLDIPSKNIHQDANGESFIHWRDTILPFKPLKEILVFNRQLSRGNMYSATKEDDMISVVVVRSANTMIALQIDQVLSEQEIVIKQFEGPAPKPSGVAGATVLGDGMIMPIADVLEIIDIFQGKRSKHIVPGWQQPGSPLNEAVSEKVETTVLIVDDSITVRELLSLTFNKAGYRVEQARDGQEAWDKLRSGLPCDIVFCDIEMPRCDGLELLSRIQKDSTLNNLPIAMLTSRGADKHRQVAVQLGASGYFTKPYLEEALLEAALRMLKGEKLVTI